MKRLPEKLPVDMPHDALGAHGRINAIIDYLKERFEEDPEYVTSLQTVYGDELKDTLILKDRGAYYWHVDAHGTVVEWCDEYSEMDNWAYSIGNYFKSKNQAEEYKEKLLRGFPY